MKKFYSMILLAFACIVANQLKAQIRVLPADSGYIFTFVSPSDNYRVKINGVLQEKTNRFPLKKGDYNLSIWAPNHFQWDTTIALNSKRVKVAHALTPTQELIDYRQHRAEYSRLKGKTFTGGILGILVSSAAIFNYQRIGNLNFDKIKAENGVKFDFEGYSQESVSEAEDKLNRARALQYVLYGGIALSATYSVLNYVKMKKLGVPKLKEDQKFLVQGIGVGVNQFNNPQFYTSIRF